MNPRDLLRACFDAGVDAVRGDRLLERHSFVDGDRWCYDDGTQRCVIALPAGGSGGRIIAVGAGKAAASLAAGLEAVLGDRLDGSEVIVKYGHVQPLRRIRLHEAAHPTPDAAGESATRVVVERLSGLRAGDVTFVLLTGGASALLVAPAPGLTLADKARTHELLVRSGAPIDEINVVRKQLSAVKGGRLLRHAGTAHVCTIAISDVPGNDPSTIGSGPTVPDASTAADAFEVLTRHDLLSLVPVAVRARLERARDNRASADSGRASAAAPHAPYLLIADNTRACCAAAAKARERGTDATVSHDGLVGDVRAAAVAIATRLHVLSRAREVTRSGERPAREHDERRRPRMLIAGGEPTVRVRGDGRGGRSQQLALEVALALRDVPFHWSLLAAGTDGSDGPTDAAGAFVDDSTLARATAIGLDPQRAARANDCYPFFSALDDLLHTGPTGTNVMDLMIAMT